MGAEGAAPSASATAAPDLVPKAPVAPAEPCPKTRPSPAAKGRNIKSSPAVEASPNSAMVETDALATLDSKSVRYESSSLNAKRAEARTQQAQKLSNLEVAHEVMRIVIRQIVAKMASSSSSLGDQRTANRARAIEHAYNVEVSHSVITMVMQGAYCRLQAKSLGCMNRNSSDFVVEKNEKDPEIRSASQSVVASAIRQASSIVSTA